MNDKLEPLKSYRLFDDNVRGVEESKWTTTDTFYPLVPVTKVARNLLPQRDAIPANGVFFLTGIRVPLHFPTRTARSWRKPWRQKKKHRRIAARQRRKKMKRLKGTAYGYPVFRCAVCNEAFVGGLTIAECRAQYEAEFPGDTYHPGCMDTVCDPCFRKVASDENRAEWAARGNPDDV